MFWDRVAPLYDLAINTLNRRVYDGTGGAIARLIRPGDTVLECACGTGAISAAIAPACARVVATDYSEGMLKQARKKLAKTLERHRRAGGYYRLALRERLVRRRRGGQHHPLAA